MDRASVLVAVSLSTLVGFAAFTMAASEVTHMFDPCNRYGEKGTEITGTDGCRSVTTTSETRGETVMRLLLVQGSAIAAMILAWWGAGRNDGRWFAGGAVIFGTLTIALLLGFFWWLTLPTAIACGVAAYRTWPTPDR